MKTMSKDQRIVNFLLLNASFINNLGLMHGKMGISIYFFHLARQTKNKTYGDYAGELIDEIYGEISTNIPIGFENGLAGIGWGIEYLVQEGFIEADTNEILAEFDQILSHELIHHCPESISLLNGLMGLGFYFLMRISGKNKPGLKEMENKQVLVHIIDLLDQRLTDTEIERMLLPGTDGAGSSGQATTRNPQPIGFDLAWDYFILLWFMGELYESQVFNAKVVKMTKHLIKPLSYEINFPQNQYKRLLLVMGVQKMLCSGIGGSFFPKEISIREVSQKLSASINHQLIRTELNSPNASVKHGAAGLAWCYYQLHQFTMDDSYLEYCEYWLEQLELINQKSDWLMGIDQEKVSNGFGILEGLVGIGLSYIYLTQVGHLTISN